MWNWNYTNVNNDFFKNWSPELDIKRTYSNGKL